MSFHHSRRRQHSHRRSSRVFVNYYGCAGCSWFDLLVNVIVTFHTELIDEHDLEEKLWVDNTGWNFERVQLVNTILINCHDITHR